MEQQVGTHSAPAQGQITLGELEMHYLDWGGGGTPVLALHGAASSSHWYDLVIPHLRDRFRFIAPDQRAHGKSSQPAARYDWATLAADAIGLLDRLDVQRAAVIGHSWGGGGALSLALLHPDRVSALALVEGGFSSGPRSQDMTWDDFKRRAAQRDIYGAKERYLGALRSGLEDCWSDELEQILLTMVRHDPDGTVWETLTPQTHEQMLWAMWSDPPSRDLAQVRCPTLIVAANRNRPDNSEWQRWRKERVAAAQATLPSAQVVWIQDTGHDIGFEKPRELADALGEFLGGI